jgi:membrane-associated protein
MRRESSSFLLPYCMECSYHHAWPCPRAGSRIFKDERHVFESITHLLKTIYDVEGLIRWGGPLLVCIIVFIETGFFVGFFLPGDSLLVTAGVFSAAGTIPLRWILLPVMLCAIVGDQIGYWVGRAAGGALYRRKDSFFFRRSQLQRAHDFYEKYGGKTVILARFVPIIRTFCPPVAGAAVMPYSRYLVYDIFGGIFWVGTMVLGGFFLGRSIPNISQRIHYVIAVVVFLSILPAIISILRARPSSPAGSAPPRATIPETEGK